MATKSNQFHLISSNRLEKLAEDLSLRLATDCGKSVLSPELIVVQSGGMARWLQLTLAGRNGICGNVKFPFPGKFVSDYVFKPLLTGHEENLLKPELQVWKIFATLSQLIADNDSFSELKNYCEDDPDGLKKFGISFRIAELFEQLLVFRPDLIREWDNGHNPLGRDRQSVWLWKLWQKTVGDKRRHFAALYRDFMCCTYPDIYSTVNTRPVTFKELESTRRIFLFGFSSMSPAYLDIFLAISRYVQVYFYYFNPSQDEWQYDLSEKIGLKRLLGETRNIVEKADCRGSEEELNEPVYLDSGNPFLNSLGLQGKEFFGLLGETDETPEPYFEEPVSPQLLLHQVQRDIQLNRATSSPLAIASSDRSIQLHSCYSRMREVEILLENLTEIFLHDSSLMPKDVLVLTPDIETYTPFIEAVFTSREKSDPRWCQISIADRNPYAALPAVEAFISLLQATSGRFKAPEIISILETPAIAARFDFTPERLEIVRSWLIRANVSWGVDGCFREQTCGIAFSAQSWRDGLKRMLAGFAFGSDTEPEQIYTSVSGEKLLPFYCCDGSNAELLGNLVEFLERLFGLREELYLRQLDNDIYTASWWKAVLLRTIDGFFASQPEFAREVGMLREVINTTTSDLAAAGEQVAVSPPVIISELRRRCQRSAISGGFLRGGITFCELRPMRSIPARIICLLGMDEKSFPRMAKALSFDLLQRYPRYGDRSSRNDDRFLFLEALLSARDCLYLSYVGQSIKDNAPLPPSVLVSELLDYLTEYYHAENDDEIIEQIRSVHPLQAFNWKYFSPDSDSAKQLVSYSRTNAMAARQLFEPSREFDFLADMLSDVMESESGAGVESGDYSHEAIEVTLSELIEFYRNPSRYFLEKQLQLVPSLRDTQEPAEKEPFDLDYLSRYRLVQEMLHFSLAQWKTLNKKSLHLELRENFHAAGVLPVGAWGDQMFDTLFSEFCPFVDRIVASLGKPMEPINSALTLSEGGLQIELNNIYGYNNDSTTRQIDYRFSKIKDKNRYHIECALNGLALCASGTSEAEARLLGRDGYCRMNPITTDSARSKLNELLRLYRLGLQVPLPFFPETSIKYAQAYIGSGNVKNALTTARTGKWENGFQRVGEVEDDFIRFCFGTECKNWPGFHSLAVKIYDLLFEPIEFTKGADEDDGI